MCQPYNPQSAASLPNFHLSPIHPACPFKHSATQGESHCLGHFPVWSPYPSLNIWVVLPVTNCSLLVISQQQMKELVTCDGLSLSQILLLFSIILGNPALPPCASLIVFS